jgi:hypothetical protein
MSEKPSKRTILPPTMRRLTTPWKVILFPRRSEAIDRTFVDGASCPSDSNLVPFSDHAIDGELDITEGCMRPFEVSFLVFEAHALAQKLIDDGVVVVVPPLIEYRKASALFSSVPLQAVIMPRRMSQDGAAGRVVSGAPSRSLGLCWG